MTSSKITLGVIVAVILLAIFAIVGTASAEWEEAQRVNVSLSQAGVATYLGEPSGDITEGYCVWANFYNGEFPNEESEISGGGDCSVSEDPWEQWIEADITSYAHSSILLGEGNYWVGFGENDSSDPPPEQFYIAWAVDSEGRVTIPAFLNEGNSRVIGTPYSGTDPTASTTVSFQQQYFIHPNNPASIACIQIYDTVNPTTTNICQDVSSLDGSYTFATSTTLTAGKAYTARGTLINTDGGTNFLDVGNWSFFNVVTTYQSAQEYWSQYGTSSTSTIDSLNFQCDPEDDFWSESVCNLAVLLFIPSQNSINSIYSAWENMKGRAPFAYAFSIHTMFSELPTTEQAAPSLTVTMWEGVNVEILGASTSEPFLPDSVRETFHAIATIAIWVAVGYALWEMRKRIFV